MNKQPDKGGPTQVQAKVQNIRLARMRQELEQMRGNPQVIGRFAIFEEFVILSA